MNLLEADGITLAFGGVKALDNISFAVQPGEIFGVIGPNGAGKTSLLNVISGVFKPRAGTLRFDGQAILGLPPHCLARLGIARTFQIVQPFARMTVHENVVVGAMFGHARLHHRLACERAADAALERTGLASKRHFYPPQLTLAERKRLEVARALAMQPRLLLLDEVMAGLNHTEIERTITLIKTLRDDGLTVVVIEHVMKAVLALTDRLLVLNFGAKLAEGFPGDVVRDPAVIKAYLGQRFLRMSSTA